MFRQFIFGDKGTAGNMKSESDKKCRENCESAFVKIQCCFDHREERVVKAKNRNIKDESEEWKKIWRRY